MGIHCVAVYSKADSNAPHVNMADEAVCIGPPPPQDSYLSFQAIIAAAQTTGCSAIHPGYGFLSENPDFASAVEAAGLTLIGPAVDSIKIMGDKLTAKELAKSAGISTIPGTDSPLKDAAEAKKFSDQIGYPVMLKAAAGGGGKGMRVVYNSDELAEAFERVSNEAHTGFGDDRIFVEKFIENPRHIEIQILADTHGNVIHLGERECSLQRRHQKVIEEAPSPFVDAKLRESITKQAVALAKAVNYHSAGTVEFVVGEDHQYYFLEMNTRLQVEHPVTEFITGLDLVEEMIRIAAGEPLRYKQNDIKFTGHAIEARVYAEDSARGFLPSSGRLVHFRPPVLDDQLRLDTGVREGSEISTYYDPMISKLIAYGPDRDTARLKLIESLDGFYIRGVETNLSFLSHLLNTETFQKAQISTTYLDTHYPDGYVPEEDNSAEIAIATAATMLAVENRHNVEHSWVVLGGRTPHPVCITYEGYSYTVSSSKWRNEVEPHWLPFMPVFSALFNGYRVNVQLDHSQSGTRLSWHGKQARVQVVTPRVAELIQKIPEKTKADHSGQILSPMPGMVIDIRVKPGDHIKGGQAVAIVEAMKMENLIQSPRDGIVAEVLVKKGESVNVDQKLVILV